MGSSATAATLPNHRPATAATLPNHRPATAATLPNPDLGVVSLDLGGANSTRPLPGLRRGAGYRRQAASMPFAFIALRAEKTSDTVALGRRL